jgi:hypothetical protein
MRLAFLLSTLFLLAGCSGMSPSQMTDGESPSSLMGSQGGGGVETTIWSDNPDQRTLTNEHPVYSGD